MRILLALLLTCLVGCAAMPPVSGGVFHHDTCVAAWQSNDFPLEVVVDRRLPPEAQVGLQAAISIWNDAAGSPVFTITREIDWWDRELLDPHEGTIYVMYMDLPSPLLGLCSLEWPDCRNHYAIVTFDVAAPFWGATLIFEHELGHALGLTHDDWQPSIMWPYALESGGRILHEDLRYVQWEMTHGYSGNPSLPASDSLDAGGSR